MLIKHKDRVINFENVTSIFKDEEENGLGINFANSGFYFLQFSNEEEMNKAFEKIMDAYRWQRMVCDLA